VRVDPVLLCAAALVSGAYLCTAFWPGLIALGLVTALLTRTGKVSKRCATLACCAFALGGLRAALALHHYEAGAAEIQDWIQGPKRCAADGSVVSSPSAAGDTLAFTALLVNLDCEGWITPGPLRVRLYGGPGTLARGDRFHVVAGLAPPQVFHNGELQDPGPRQLQQGVVLTGSVLALDVVQPGTGLWHFMDRQRARARERIQATFSPKAVGMAQALVLGEGNLSDDDAQAFRTSGLAHLLAVSGTHLVFAVLGLMRIVRYYLVRIEGLALRLEIDRYVALLGAVLAPLYADFAGGSGSAWRAAWMLCAALLAKALGRRPAASRALAASLGAGVVCDPVVAYDISFLLSLAATAGLLSLGQGMTACVGRASSKAVQFLQSAALATLASMVPCLPLLALLSPSFTLASIGANVIAAPLGEAIALPLCLLHVVVTPCAMLETGIARVASGALVVIQRVAHASANVTWLRCEVPPPSAWQLAILVLGGASVLCCLPNRIGSTSGRKFAVWLCIAVTFAALGCSELQLRLDSPDGTLRVTAVDVGQGDASLIDLPTGSLMLIDGGGIVGSKVDPGSRIIEPLLRARRRERVDVMVLSHPHPDHFLGLIHVAKAFVVGEVWDTGQGEQQGAGPDYDRLLSILRERGVTIRRPQELCGDHQIGGATVQVLAPCPGYDPKQSANDNSFVIKVRHGAHAALLMGDAERHAEVSLLENASHKLRADFLKVGHHGSRTSTSPAFLAAVQPRLASISCGVRNTFGHPHPEAVLALQAQQVLTLRLDQVGSVTWQSNGREETLSASSMRDNPLWNAVSSLW